MATSWDIRSGLRALLDDEVGTLHKEAEYRVALVYPSPYRTAMSSLGYQEIYGTLNDMPGVAADRAFLPDDEEAWRSAGGSLVTIERETPLGEYPMLAFSVAYELELLGLISCLDLAGIPPLAAERDSRHPFILGGGPLTFSNPAPLGPYCEAIILGEAEELVLEVVGMVRDTANRSTLLSALARIPGMYVPSIHGERVPPIAQVHDGRLPARSRIITKNTELTSMFLTETGRGCSRGCTYCVMRRSTNGGMRTVEVSRILGGIPEHARRVGLVGAAVTDHPGIRDIVRGVVDAGREVGISSLRADRLDDELVELLARGGYRTLTVAADGASERMRKFIERRTYERHLIKCAELAKRHGLITFKMYMMLGIPGETDDDVDELVRFITELRKIHPRIALGLAPFVAKRNTPLDGEPYAGIDVVERRLVRLRKGLKGAAEVRPTSARWAWVEYMLAQGDSKAGLAVMDAWRGGGTFAAWKRAFADAGVEPTGPRARVPSVIERAAQVRAQLPVVA